MATIQYARLYPDTTQLQAKDGHNLTAGWVEVYLAGTDDPAITYADYNGTRNPQKIVVDDKSVQMSDTALRRETLIFTSDSTAMYYNDYYAARSEDDVHRTGKCTYEFDGTYGDITLTEKYDNGYNNTLNGWFMYDKGILTWEKSVSDMDSPKVFTRR